MGGRWLEKLALHRPELRAWALYDWANSAFVTVVMTAVFPIHYAIVSKLDGPAALERLGWATTIALAVAAVLAPILGALADHTRARKRLFVVFLLIGVAATAGLVLATRGQGWYALALFVVANIAAAASFVLYDAFLPHLAGPREMDRLSTSGFALGYLGGGLVLALILLAIEFPASVGASSKEQATRWGYGAVAAWWLLFSIPFLLRVKEPARVEPLPGEPSRSLFRVPFERLRATFSELRRYRQALLMLLAFLAYNDGVLTIIRFATIYGRAHDLADHHLILAILLVQGIGIPSTVLLGGVAERLGAQRTVFLSIGVYFLSSCFALFLAEVWHFYVLAILIGLVQGGCQGLSRSLFASMIPRDRSAEFFGFFSVAQKFAGILGPLGFSLVLTLTGSLRAPVLVVMACFLVGGLLLTRVDVEAGRRAVAGE